MVSDNHNGKEKQEGKEITPEQNVKKESLKNRFIKSFIKFHYNREKGGGTEFLNTISKAGEKNTQITKMLERYSSGIEEFKGIDLNSITYNELMSEITGKLLHLNNCRVEFKKKILNEYDITPHKYTLEILKHVEQLNEKEIKKFIVSDELTGNFLAKLLGKRPDRKELLNKLKNFNLSKDRYDKLPDKAKDALAFFYNKVNNFYSLSTFDIQELFALGVFRNEEKIDFVKQFLPAITLAEALKLKLINKKTAEEYKKAVILKGLAGNENIKLDETDVDSLLNSLRDEKIYIDIEKVVKSPMDAMRIMSSRGESIKNIRDDFNAVIANAQGLYEKGLSRDFDKLKADISKLGKMSFESLEKFKTGNIIAITERSTSATKKEQGIAEREDTTRYFVLEDDGVETGKMKLVPRGTSSSYDTSLDKPIYLEYNKFISLLTRGLDVVDDYGEPVRTVTAAKVESFTPEEINEKIQKLEIQEDTDKFTPVSIERLTEQRKLKYAEIKERLESELDEHGNKKWDDNKIEELLEEDEELKKIDKEIQEAPDLNLSGLTKKIDELDEAGTKYLFGKGVTFQVGQEGSKDFGIYTVVSTDNGEIVLESIIGREPPISYQDFYNAFKEKKAKRTSNVCIDFSGLIEAVGLDDPISSIWKQFEFKDGAIQKKEGTAKEKVEYPFLASIDSEELLQIKNISGDKVTFYAGDIKSKKDEKTKKSITSYGVDKSRTFTVTLGWLHTYIKNHKLVPRNFEKEGIDEREENIPEIKGRKKKFFSSLFSNFSIAEIISGSKMGLEALQNYLKEGNDNHAAKFASGVFGKFLPEGVRRDLKARVEQTEKKAQDEYIEKLKSVDSSDASFMIESWLLNKSSPEYKKEAGLIFMMEKYGTLYAKGGLAKYKGKFLWYRALGGEVGDALYNDIKAEQEAGDLPFNEDYLVYRLLVKQCKGELKPVRRTRLHKEYKRLRAQGKKDEMDTGRNDAADERNIEGRVKGGMGELEGGTYPNAIGWLEKVVEKGGSMHVMSKIPFIMAFSGIAYGFDHVLILDALKSFNGKGYLLPITRFMSHVSDMNLLNETIRELAIRIEARSGGKYDGMGTMATEIFSEMKDNSIKDFDKIKKTEKFFDKYGEVLTRSLYMLNDGKTDDDSSLSKIIFFEKDAGYVDEKGIKQEKGNQVFKSYYDTFRTLIDADTKWDNKDTMTDAFRKAGTSGFHLQNASKNVKQDQGGGFRNLEMGVYMWEEISDEFDAIVKRDYSMYGEDAKKKLLEDDLRQFLSGLLELHSSRDDLLKAIVKKSSAIGYKLRYWGIDMLELSRLTDYRRILKSSRGGVKSPVDGLIEKYVKNMTSGKDYSSEALVEDTDYSRMFEVTESTKRATHNTLLESDED
ncbi:MAG: hypothetical protein PHH06_00575 [Candidatus Gracilibacteria bacterium]|nr:hypothetical protein [Candidatus Gracilibacteria bacterium]